MRDGSGIVREALAEALGLLLPVDCAGCGRPDRPLCATCAGLLRAAPEERMLPGGLRVVSGLRFEGVPARVLRALKQDGRTPVARPLGRVLAAAVAVAGFGAEIAFVPVPSSRAARRRRGYVVTELLMRGAGLSVTRMLRPARRTADQRGLGRDARAGNVDGSLVARPAAGRPIVLVDDVLTTGATLTEAARAVRAAGGVVEGAVTVAATPLRRAPNTLF